MLVVVLGSPSQAAGLTAADQLRDAPIPASCGHPATRLDGTRKDFGSNGFARLLTGNAVFGALRRSGTSDVVPLVCSAGGVTWPERLLAYAPGPRLLGAIELRRLRPREEHVDVRALRLAHRTASFALRAYQGANFDVAEYRGAAWWKDGRLAWSPHGPLTIGYDPGHDNTDGFGYGVVTSRHDASTWLTPAPAGFRRFVAGRWERLAAQGCRQRSVVQVDRYSHRGFVDGAEGNCGGAHVLWARTRGHWRLVSSSQDVYDCARISRLERRALHVLGRRCYDGDTGRMVPLGRWPRSGR